MSKKYWFKRKTYGYGWTPCTWEGWVFLAVATAAYILPMTFWAKEYPVALIFYTFVWIGLLTLVSYLKGPRPRWQWGQGDELADPAVDPESLDES